MRTKILFFGFGGILVFVLGLSLITKTCFAYSSKTTAPQKNQVHVSAVVLEHISYYRNKNGHMRVVTNIEKGVWAISSQNTHSGNDIQFQSDSSKDKLFMIAQY